MLLRNELESISSSDDSYLIHEHLEDINEPLYFHQFAERAKKAGLQYLAEADFGVMAMENFPPNVRAMLESVSRGIIETEQYMDFLPNRPFRQTLLVHQDATVERPAKPQRLLKLRVASSSEPEGEVKLQSNEQATFRRGPSMLATNDPVVKAAMLELRKVWPLSIPFAELASIARSAAVSRPVAVDAEVMSPASHALAATLLRCFATNQVDLHASAPLFTTMVSDRPVASLLARTQAARGPDVTSRRHATVSLDDLQRQVLSLLDGMRDRAALTHELTARVQRAELLLHEGGQRVTDAAAAERLIAESLESVLQSLAHRALLIS